MYKVAILRPITTLMFTFAIIFFGYMEVKKMPVALFPNIDYPVIIINTIYDQGSTQIVESKITDKIEEAISSIPGIETIRSNSYKNHSLVIAQFEIDKEIEEAANDVRDKVSSVILPLDAKKPIIQKLSSGSTPIISLFLSTQKEDKEDLMLYANEMIKPMLQSINGVGEVSIIGFRDKLIRIIPQPTLLSKYNIDLNFLAGRISEENIKKDGGILIQDTTEYNISIDSEALNIEDLGNIKIKEGIRLKDIAKIEESIKEERTFGNYNGKEGVILQVKKIPGANEIQIAREVKEKIPIMKKLSDNFDMDLIFDMTTFIEATYESVKFDLVLGCVLASLIVFVFLRNFTFTLIAAISLPISILGVLALMAWANQNLNVLTLTALTLSIGIIIDDAIVVIENIYKRIEEGKAKFEASLEGIKDISFSILAISSMLLAIFIPVANMNGIVGKFFVSFGITVAAAVIVSYIVAITIIPMVSSLIINPKKSKFYLATEHFFIKMEELYKKLLSKTLKYRKTTVLFALIVFIISIKLSSNLGMVFMPKEDKSQFEISIKANTNISMQEMKKISLEVQNKLLDIEELEYSSLLIGLDSKLYEAIIYVKLLPIAKRIKSQQEIMKELLEKSKTFENLEININEIDDKGSGAEILTPFQIVLKSYDEKELHTSLNKLTEFLQTIKGTTNIQNNIQKKKEELSLEIISQNASKYAVSSSNIAKVIAMAYSGEISISKFNQNGKEYDIVMRLSDDLRASKEILSQLNVRNNKGDLIPLSSLVNINTKDSTPVIKRYDRQKQLTLGSDITGDLALDTLVKEVIQNEDKWLSNKVSYKFLGDAKYMRETSESFSIAIFIALVMIYLILASLYESPIQPIIIMSAMPLSFTGAFLGLYFANMNMSLFSIMGLFLLLGLVGKNSTLIVDTANKNRLLTNLDEAILQASISRLRPILMTSIAMCLGMLPLAIATQEGSSIKVPMGITVISGLLLSTILSLFIVPALYKILAPLDDKVRKLYSHDK